MPYLETSKSSRTFYRLIPGSDDRPYLVFLHEGLGSVTMWKDFPDAFCQATGCPGLVYDRLGFGRSSPQLSPRTVHYLHYNGLVELFEVLDGVIAEKPFWLVGHSDGASIALICAAERPARLEGVIAEAPHVKVEPVTLKGIRRTVQTYDERMRNALSKHHGRMAERVFAAWHEIWLSPAFRHWNIEYLLPSVLCPCLILHGRQDPYGTVEQARLIASKLSGPCRLEIIEACAHAPHRDAAEIVLPLMIEFMENRRR